MSTVLSAGLFSLALLTLAERPLYKPIYRPIKHRPLPEYYKAPLAEQTWQSLLSQHLLLTLTTGTRMCVQLVNVAEKVIWVREPGQDKTQQIHRVSIGAVHKNSWECTRETSSPTPDWVVPAVSTSFTLAALNLGMAFAFDFSVHRDEQNNVIFGPVKPYHYAVLGLPTAILAAPIAGIAGYSASRDLRVRGFAWARWLGWSFYGASLALSGLWIATYYGNIDKLKTPGTTIAGAGTSFLGSVLLTIDAFKLRQQAQAIHRQDAHTPTQSATWSLSLLPIHAQGQGMQLGLQGVF